jgi:hypothetical protein
MYRCAIHLTYCGLQNTLASLVVLKPMLLVISDKARLADPGYCECELTLIIMAMKDHTDCLVILLITVANRNGGCRITCLIIV